MSSREHSDEGLESATIVDSNGHDFPIGGDNGLLEVGEEVGEYIVDQPIGKGGMGVVYRATHKIIGKHAAVKVLHRAAGARQASRLIAEARAVNQICHENIVDVFDFGVLHDGRPFVVMELLVGRPLDSCLVPGEAMSVVEALRIVGPVASALQAAHSQGIVHRDLKPANIFLSDEGVAVPRVKLLDFGIAKFLDADSNQGLTTDGMVLGTLSYMAPEIASGKDVSVHADTYSLGVMLYQMLVGSLPFTGQNSLETLYAHVHTPPPTPTEKHIKLPRELESLLLRMLAKKPKDRPSLSEIASYATNCSEDADSLRYLTPLKLLPSEIQSPRKKRIALVALGLASLCGVVLLLLSLQTSSKSASPAGEEEHRQDEAIGSGAIEADAAKSPGAGADEQARDVDSKAEPLEETMELVVEETALDSPEGVQREPAARKRNQRRRPRKLRGKRQGQPADDAPIDPLRGMR